MTVFIGTSGWQYQDWKGAFYPPQLPQGRWLEHYAAHFSAVELNSTFYRQPAPETFDGWARRTPDDFVFAVKANRYLTHVRRLQRPKEPVERFLEGALRLGRKLGPVLIQLPPTLALDLDGLAETLACFPRDLRIALEPRHRSWYDERVFGLLAARDAALCLADSAHDRPRVWRTASWAYVRFHEGRASPWPCYGRRALASWARRLAATWGPDAEAFLFFNNDLRTCAPRDAAQAAREVERVGLQPTRAPARRAIPIG